MLTIEIEREEDGRWIAQVSELAGVTALALPVIADRIEHGEPAPIDPVTLLAAA